MTSSILQHHHLACYMPQETPVSAADRLHTYLHSLGLQPQGLALRANYTVILCPLYAKVRVRLTQEQIINIRFRGRHSFIRLSS